MKGLDIWEPFAQAVVHKAIELRLSPEEAMHVWKAGIESYKAVREQQERTSIGGVPIR